MSRAFAIYFCLTFAVASAASSGFLFIPPWAVEAPPVANASAVDNSTCTVDGRQLVVLDAGGGSPEIRVCKASTWTQLPSGGGSGISDHGALTGLGDDDHPQYLTSSELGSLADLNAQISAALVEGPHTTDTDTTCDAQACDGSNFSGVVAVTAAALISDPAACPGGEFVTDIAASGTLTCATPASGGGGLSGSGTTGTVALWTGSGSVGDSPIAVEGDGSISIPGGTDAAPALVDSNDTDLGITFGTNIGFCNGGSCTTKIMPGQFGLWSSQEVLAQGSSNCLGPTVAAHTDPNTGFAALGDVMRLCAGGVEGIKVSEAASAITIEVGGPVKLAGASTLPTCDASSAGTIEYDDSGAFCGCACPGGACAWLNLGGGGACA